MMTFKGTKCIVKNLPPKYTLGSNGFICVFSQAFKRLEITIYITNSCREEKKR